MTEWNGLPTPRRYWSAAAIWLALTMSVLDSSIANVALPTIGRDLAATASESIWMVNAYQIAVVVSLLPLAALGEIVTYRRIYQCGLALFVVASIGCTFAHTLPQLALARAVQGLGAAGVMSVNGALLRFTYPKHLMGRGVGLNAMVVSIASVLGPSIASAILAVGSWRWLFAVNVPVGLCALILASFALPQSPRAERSLDWLSAGLNVLTFGLIITGVDVLTRGGGALLGSAALVVGIGAGAGLVLRSASQPSPLAPIDLLRSRLYGLTALTSVASFSAQMLAYVSLPFFLQGWLHRTPVETGLLMTPWPLAVGIAAPLAGKLSDKYPAAILCGIGLIIMTCGLISLALLPPHAGVIDIGWRMALCGLGFGFFQAPNNRTMLTAAPIDRTGAAGGMLATARLTGQTAGATAAAILFRASQYGPTLALALGAAFAATGAVVSLARLADRGEKTASS